MITPIAEQAKRQATQFKKTHKLEQDRHEATIRQHQKAFIYIAEGHLLIQIINIGTSLIYKDQPHMPKIPTILVAKILLLKSTHQYISSSHDAVNLDIYIR